MYDRPDRPETVTPTLNGAPPTATTQTSLIPTEATPDPKMSGIFGGLGGILSGAEGFFQRLTGNPILLLIIVVVLVFVVGKMF